MNVAEKMMDAIAHQGRGPVAAWLMFLATYSYTRAHDGIIANEQGERYSFGRWYSFCAALETAWHYLWPENGCAVRHRGT